MKLTIPQSSLARALAVVGRSVAARSTLPVLSCVHLEADTDGFLRASATNLELGTTIDVDATVEVPGAVAVPARLLTEFVGGLPAGKPVALGLHERTQTLNIKCGRYEANIKGIDAQEFPLFTTVEDGVAFSIHGGDLKTMIERVAIAVAKDERRPILHGVLCEALDDGLSGGLTMAAADGYRLAVDKADAEMRRDAEAAVVIPVATLLEVRRVCGDDGEVAVVFGERQAMFTMGDVTMVSQLIEGNFPDYRQIIPKDYATRVTLPTAALTQALKMAMVFAASSANTVGLSVMDGQVIIAAASADQGDNISVLEAEVIGAPIEIQFNVRYLLDAVAGVHAEQTIIEMRDKFSSVIVKEHSSAEYRCVVMPIHAER